MIWSLPGQCLPLLYLHAMTVSVCVCVHVGICMYVHVLCIARLMDAIRIYNLCTFLLHLYSQCAESAISGTRYVAYVHTYVCT